LFGDPQSMESLSTKKISKSSLGFIPLSTGQFEVYKSKLSSEDKYQQRQTKRL